MTMIRILFLESVLIFALSISAGAQPAGTFGPVSPQVRLLEGDPAQLEVELDRSDLVEWPGFRLRARVTNHSDAAVRVGGVDLMDRVPGQTLAEPSQLRVLTFDQRGDLEVRVFPLATRVESRRFVAAALPGRGAAMVAGFITGDSAHLALELERSQLALSAWTDAGDLTLEPGQSLATPELTVLFCDDGLRGLEWLFEQMELQGQDEPFPLNSAPAVPLDLFAGDGTPSVWRPRGPAHELLLRNAGPEILLCGSSFRDMGLDGNHLHRISEILGKDQERDLGLFSRGLQLPLAPASEIRLRVTPTGTSWSPHTGFELLLLRNFGPDLPMKLEPVESNDPALAELLATTLNESGVVIANHRGTEVLDLLPAALDAILAPTVIPYRAKRATVPGLDEEHLFALRSANLEWALDFPAQDLAGSAWLVSPEAGLLVTPLQPVLADGLPGARGFAAHVGRGLVLVTMDLSAEDRNALVSHCLDRDRALDAMRQAALARIAVNAPGKPTGLFRELGLERYQSEDLVPADVAAMNKWAVLIPGGRRRIRTLLIRPGLPSREQVLELGRNMTLGLDTEIGDGELLVFVVRRAPAPSPLGYQVNIDNTPLGPPIAPRGEDPANWQEDVWLLGKDLIRNRGRVTLNVVPIGGALPLARIGFFRYRPKPGIPLHSLSPLDVQHGGAAPKFNRSAGGNVLRIAGEAFLFGIGCGGNTRIEYPLNGNYESFLVRAGIDAEVGRQGAAVLRILLDGEERYRSDHLRGGDEALPISVNVKNARRLVLEVSAGDAESHLDLVDARLTR
ncbi:MAG: NPCBM/NEW2 domain-containing protein [Planctomycetota bacterium]